MEADWIVRLDPEAVKAALDRGHMLVLVDVRKPSVYARGRISGAICLPVTDMEAGTEALPTETLLVFY
jgi:rhodanese-related sulfurtransferase